MKATEISPTEFRQKVERHLQRAMASIPATVPQDVVTDLTADRMMRELDELTDFLYTLGAEEREHEQQEHHRKLKLAGKRENPRIEKIAERIDERIQHAMVCLGSEAKNVLAAMNAQRCIAAFVEFLDAFPTCAFAADRSLPIDMESSHDITVATIIAAMRIRKQPQR